MHSRTPTLCAVLAGVSLLFGNSAQAASGQKPLRVCADPAYMPYSNQAREGFENKVAQIIADGMGRSLEYQWASYRGHGGFSNFLAENLDARKCDVIMNLPDGDPEENSTNPYYVSSYVFIYKKDKNLHFRTMNSVSLQHVKIGLENETAPEVALKIRGLTDHIVGFDIADNPEASPKSMLQAVQDDKVGVMITWEPAIGYFMKDFPDLKIVRVPNQRDAVGMPPERYTFAMSMGVRPHDDALKDEINQALKAQKPKIDAVLAQYDVKLYPDLQDKTNDSY